MNYRILSIDAWRDGPGWTWNNWFHVGDYAGPEGALDNPRALLRYMRESGYLGAHSRGRVAIEDDGYNVVIMARGTREPLFAIEYGPHV